MRIIMHVATPQRLSLTESSSMPAARYPQRHEPVQYLGGPLAFDALLAPVMGFAETGLPCVPNSACRALSSSSASPRPLTQTQPCQTEQKQACTGKKNGIGRNSFRCRFP